MPTQIQAVTHEQTQVPVSLNLLPDECPACHHGIQPKFCGTAQVTREGVYCPLRCPRDECTLPFFAIYKNVQGAPFVILDRLAPILPKAVSQSKNIADVSPDYYRIFDQASAAEQHGLTEIAGPGYRKALEFLIKDYAVREARDALAEATTAADAAAAAKAQHEIDTVRNMLLANVIANKIGDDDIKNMATRAAWLGNDETHYTRLWEGHDLADLKHLLSLVEGFVDRKESARRYMLQMPKR